MATKEETALEVVAEISGTGKDELKAEMNLVADLGIDSPKALKLLVELEDRLEIEISDEEAARMDTVGDVLAFFKGTP